MFAIFPNIAIFDMSVSSLFTNCIFTVAVFATAFDSSATSLSFSFPNDVTLYSSMLFVNIIEFSDTILILTFSSPLFTYDVAFSFVYVIDKFSILLVENLLSSTFAVIIKVGKSLLYSFCSPVNLIVITSCPFSSFIEKFPFSKFNPFPYIKLHSAEILLICFGNFILMIGFLYKSLYSLFVSNTAFMCNSCSVEVVNVNGSTNKLAFDSVSFKFIVALDSD